MTLLNDMREDNLAARFGSRQDKQIETSCVVGARPFSCEHIDHWYRELRSLKWIWAGADPLILQEVYARIAASPNQRSQELWLDTVKGYRPGNWIYEFSQEAALFQRQARQAMQAENPESARSALLNASIYYSIASFPYLRGDFLAHEAIALASHHYELACRTFKQPVKKFAVAFEGGQIGCHVHLPHDDHPVPIVLVCSGGELLQHSFFPLFEHYLAPAGIGMVTLDLPGTGASERWPLTQDISRLHQAVLHDIVKQPWLASGKVSLFGLRFGGTLALRLAQLEPARIQAIALIGAPVHDLFSDIDTQRRCGPMICDQFAARFATDSIGASNLSRRLNSLSLQAQGMLGYHSVKAPVAIFATKGDPQVSEADVQRTANACAQHQLTWLEGHSVYNCFPHAVEQACAWLIRQLN